MGPSYGPVITAAIRGADTLDGDGAVGRGFYLEDAGVPSFGSWMLQAADTPGALWRSRRELWRALRERFSDTPEPEMGALLSALFGDATLSSGTMPLLAMGRDVPAGRMRLRGGRLDLELDRDDSEDFYKRLEQVSREVTEALGGRYHQTLTYALSRLITVHSLGGCPMGRNPDEGVVDANGEVFGWPGLHIADGSVVPGPVGANPSLTIAALADRFADRMTGA
jgi:cholesterol oxidase